MSSSAGGGSVGHVQQQQHHQLQHQTKFRWTENLTCRFIQLRKEHGKMFTGRKYSAQAGWEYILRQMREEFPTIMADVHYRVLKKKWSNLLQQYKELKNPVHGDKNKADDISWPFYTAIDEVLGRHSQQHHSQHHAQQHHGSNALHARRHYDSPDEPDNNEEFEDDEEPDDDLNPQEFLCVSVAPDSDEDNDPTDSLDLPNYAEEDGDATGGRVPGLPRLQPLGRGPVFDVDRLQSATTR